MKRLTIQQLAALFRRVGVGLGAGVDILRVWELERDRAPPAHRGHMQAIYERLRGGSTLVEALRADAGYFPPMALEMVGVGEMTGHLESVLLRLAEHYDHLTRLRRDLLNACLWPGVQLIAAILVVSLLIWISGLITDGPDLMGFGLTGVSGVLIFWLLVALLAAAAAGLVYSLARGQWGDAPIRLAMRLPVLGPFLESMALARFTWSFAVTVDVGMDARESMRLALRSTQNPVYTVAAPRADRVLADHGEFHEALEATGAFPGELVEAMRNADLSGTHTQSMLYQARQYEERFRSAAQMVAFFAAGAIRLSVGLLLIWLIFRVARIYLGTINDALQM